MQRIAFFLFLAVASCSADPGIDGAFHALQVVPQLIPAAPQSLAIVIYGGGETIHLGGTASASLVKNKPIVHWDSRPNALYTLIITVAIFAPHPSPTGENLHWLVQNIPGNNIAAGQTVADYYNGPQPIPANQYRYTVLVYEQFNGPVHAGPTIPASSENAFRQNFQIREFTARNLLGDPEAGNIFVTFQ